MMYWDQRKYELTIPLDKSTNIDSINVAPVYSKFNMYCQQDELVPESESDPLIDE